MKIIIAGCGWLGRALGAAWVADGHHVVGIRRSPDAADVLGQLGIETLTVDLASPGALNTLPPDAEIVVACQAAGGGTLEDYRRAYLTVNETLIAYSAANSVRRLVYTGSTGVFGQNDGSDVDESTPPLTSTPRAELLLQAEETIRAASRGDLATMVVRLSGLYGPERFGVIDRVRRGVLGLGDGDENWMNWCHRNDAVNLIRRVVGQGRPGALYHGSDAEPTRRRDVVDWIATRLEIDPPVLSVDAKRRGGNRRVLSRQTREELSLNLEFPSFREGLSAAF